MTSAAPLRRILLADDHVLVAEGIRKILENDYELLGVAANGRELLDQALITRPDVVILDVAMPVMNGIEAAGRLTQALPRTKLIFVTQQSGRHYAEAAFRAGAHGYVLKQSAASDLLHALQTVLRGQYYVSPLLASDLPSISELRQNPTTLFGSDMTPRQREVLQLVAEGKTLKEVASILNISVKTVEFHKHGIMEVLGLRTTAELTRYAIEHGIIHLP
jgi:DNA-binding NarL/FixJ family response regulator